MIKELLIALGLLAPPITADELNACAAMAAFEDYLQHERGNRSRAEASLAVDGYHNIVATAANYHQRFNIPTVYDGYVERGRKICANLKRAGTPIEMPQYGVPDGFHITRSPSTDSAAMVKDGDPEPTFACAQGYHPSDSAGQCVKED